MTECPRIEVCPYYKQHCESDPIMAEELRHRYCLGNYLACARYSVAKGLGGERVPDTLHPNQHAQARRILAEG